MRTRISPLWLVAGPFMAVFTSFSWLYRHTLHAFAAEHPAFYPAVFVSAGMLCLSIAISLMSEAFGLERLWLARTASRVGLEGIRPRGLLRTLQALLPDPFEIISKPIFRYPFGSRLKDEWTDAGLGSKASRYLLLLTFFATGGFLVGWRVAGLLLATALALITPIIPRAVIRSRAERHRHRFVEQLPYVLDGLAAGLAAGLSFQGSVEHILSDLDEPSRGFFARLSNRLILGIPLDEALAQLQEEANEEAVHLIADGLILQRQFGGDMVALLGDTAGLIRERIELEQEVRAITAQGRLSGIIIAALVPVSAGFLLMFNPRYIDVLFDNLIGQALVILTLILQLVGWAIISRLLRMGYTVGHG